MSDVKIGTDVLTSVVQFMQGAEGIMGKQASFDDAIASEGAGVIDALVGASMIDENCKSASVAKLMESPLYAFELLKRASEVLKEPEVEGIGVESATIKSASADEISAEDAFVNALM